MSLLVRKLLRVSVLAGKNKHKMNINKQCVTKDKSALLFVLAVLAVLSSCSDDGKVSSRLSVPATTL